VRPAPVPCRTTSVRRHHPWPAPRPRPAERIDREWQAPRPWPGAATDERPLLRGTIDFLWKEADGWHLLALDAGEGRLSAVRTLEAWVVREQYGEALRTATTLDLRTGRTVALDPHRVSLAAAGKELAEPLTRRYPAAD